MEQLIEEPIVETKQIRDYLEEIKMPALRKNLLKLYGDVEEKLKAIPASIKYHHNYQSGLYVHTLEVMQFSIEIFELYKDKFMQHFTRDDIILVAFIHDLEKVTKYKKNQSQNNGFSWAPFLYNYNNVDMNDSVEVINLICKYGIFLSDIQSNALCYHHGGWSPQKGKLTELATLLHIADLLSCNIGEIKQNG